MPQTPVESVGTHWHKLIENFQTSPKDFYTTVELALDARKIPGMKTSRVKWSESGLLSPDREYLRKSRNSHTHGAEATPVPAPRSRSNSPAEPRPARGAARDPFTAARGRASATP
ncbi:MAG: hypothetical protein HZC42_09190 [Candidatus Eisenbacteria bacterium]|nr:hypothetical protein [Candidatus Eisenbacteria bacterium]